MKVLSILQPWASLVVLGHKKIETRSWNTKYRGELLIHASKSVKAWQGLWHQEPFKHSLDDVPPFGAIIGKVKLVDTCDTLTIKTFPQWGQGKESATLTEQELAFGDYSDDRFGWLLSDPVVFEKPIPAKGKLGLWEYDPGLHNHPSVKPINQLK